MVALHRPPTAKRCFLCRRPLRETKATLEHVFPRWLLKRLDLYDHSITLANNTTIKYYQLTVPCCENCNKAGEKSLETPISGAFEQGYEAVSTVDHRTLALWCLKMYYGIRFKEHLLPRDRRNRNRGRITRQEELKEMRLLFMILQGIRMDIQYVVEPWSLWVYRVKVSANESERFYFADLVDVSMFSIRINDVGIVMLPRDFGLVKNSEYASNFDGFLDCTLHPQQLNEIAARAAYFDIIRRMGVTYMISLDSPPLVVYGGSLAARPWREWDWREYHKVLAFISKMPFEVWQPDERRLTFLEDTDGNFIDLPLDALPIAPAGDELWQAAPPHSD